MNKELFIFQQRNRHQWSVIQNTFNFRLNRIWLKQLKKDFRICLLTGDDPKTPAQLRGFYRLCTVLVPYIKEANGGGYMDVELVKELIKRRYGYFRVICGIEVTKSLKLAFKEDMIGLIMEAEKLGAELGAEDCILRNYEREEFLKYYESRA
jgi:hypothetical protein